MLTKLQALFDAIKGYLLWIVTPLLVVGGYIFYLMTKNTELQEQLKNEKADATIKQDEVNDTQAAANADSAVDAYKRLRDDYIKNTPSNK